MSSELLRTLLSIAAILSPVALLTGLFLAISGLRGRLIDDHPVCRGCGFDLIGVAGVGKGGGTVVPACPECGRDVSHARALRKGNRELRRGVAASGVAMVVLGLTGLSALGYAATRGTAWYDALPTWALALVAESSTPGNQRAAVSELGERLSSGQAEGWPIQRALSAALRIQADPNIPWLTEWGDLVEAAWNRGLVTPDQYRRFLAAGVTIGVSVNPIRDIVVPAPDSQIDVTPVVRASIARVGTSTSVAIKVRLINVRYGEHRVEGDGTESEMLTLGLSSPTIVAQQVEVPWAEGVHDATARMAISVRGSEIDGGATDQAAIESESDYTYNVVPQPPDVTPS